MELTHWKWVSRVAPRTPRRRSGLALIGKVGRAVRPLWLNSEAVQAAEQCANAAGVPVARFIDSMLFEICGAPRHPKKSAGGMIQRQARGPAQVIPIDRQTRR